MKAGYPRFQNGLDRVFQLRARGSTVRTEVRAGIAVFVSLSYIFVLAPTFLRSMNYNASHSLAVVVGVSAAMTFVAGVWARLPFAFAPGLEMLLYIAGVAVPIFGLSPQLVGRCVLFSGIVLSVLAVAKLTHKIHRYPPPQFSDAIAITMSIFLLCQAVSIAGVVSYDGDVIRIVHNIGGTWIWAVVGVVIALTLDAIGIPAPVLFSVLLVSILAEPTKSRELSSVASNHLLSTKGSIGGLSEHPIEYIWMVVRVTLTLVGLSLYGSLSKIVNLWQGSGQDGAEARNIHEDVPRMNRLMVVEGISGVVSGMAKITNVTMFVESGAGIRLGGRTGITSIVTSISMLSTLVLLPYIQYVEPVASVGALVYVGLLLFPRPRYLRRISRADVAIIVLMAGIVIGTMSLFWAMAIGFVGFVLIREMESGRGRKRKPLVAL